MKTQKLQPIFLLNSYFGVYTANVFSEQFHQYLNNEQKQDLASPDNEFYWESWQEVLDNTVFLDNDGNKYYLIQSDECDLWAIPEGTVWEDFLE